MERGIPISEFRGERWQEEDEELAFLAYYIEELF